MAEMINIEVAWGDPEKQVLLALEVEAGTTLVEAIELSGIRDQVPGMEIDAAHLGIFSRKKPPGFVLREGDRVEIYRPLIADPKEIRRKRAAEKSAQSSD